MMLHKEGLIGVPNILLTHENAAGVWDQEYLLSLHFQIHMYSVSILMHVL